MKASIRDWRKKRGITQTELAEMVGTSQVTICHWERGINVPKYKHILSLRRALRLSATDDFILSED